MADKHDFFLPWCHRTYLCNMNNTLLASAMFQVAGKQKNCLSILMLARASVVFVMALLVLGVTGQGRHCYTSTFSHGKVLQCNDLHLRGERASPPHVTQQGDPHKISDVYIALPVRMAPLDESGFTELLHNVSSSQIIPEQGLVMLSCGHANNLLTIISGTKTR